MTAEMDNTNGLVEVVDTDPDLPPSVALKNDAELVLAAKAECVSCIRRNYPLETGHLDPQFDGFAFRTMSKTQTCQACGAALTFHHGLIDVDGTRSRPGWQLLCTCGLRWPGDSYIPVLPTYYPDLYGLLQKVAAAGRISNYALACGRAGLDQGAQTPDWLYEALDGEFHFDFDPAPVDPSFDGLVVPWGKVSYVNPPYGKIEVWLKKALLELEQERQSVFLIPFRPHTQYFWKHIIPHADEVRLLDKHVCFKGYQRPLKVRISIVVFRQLGGPSRELPMQMIQPGPGQFTLSRLREILEEKFKVNFDHVRTQEGNEELAPLGSVNLLTVCRDAARVLAAAVSAFAETGKETAVVIPARYESKMFLNVIFKASGQCLSVIFLTRNLTMPNFETNSPYPSIVVWVSDRRQSCSGPTLSLIETGPLKK
jgi:hypothetical protein